MTITSPRLAQTLGPSLRAARVEAERTQDDVARALKIEPETVSLWENGRRVPEFGNLVKLAAFLGVGLAILLSAVDEAFVTKAPPK